MKDFGYELIKFDSADQAPEIEIFSEINICNITVALSTLIIYPKVNGKLLHCTFVHTIFVKSFSVIELYNKSCRISSTVIIYDDAVMLFSLSMSFR